jgi:hypothetical protein
MTGIDKKPTNCVKFVISSSLVVRNGYHRYITIDLAQLRRDFDWG